jgi:hypothetical protein
LTADTAANDGIAARGRTNPWLTADIAANDGIAARGRTIPSLPAPAGSAARLRTFPLNAGS